jgi:hypothetical protein
MNAIGIFRDIFALIGLFALLPILIHFGEEFGPEWVVGLCQDFRRYLRWREGNDLIALPVRSEDKTMVRYDESKGKDQQWVTIIEIVVPSEFDKQQLLAAIEYLHYSRDIDTDYIPVNTLVHVYENPDLVIVRG